MLRVKEAAKRLEVHPATIYRWIESGEMQHVRYGKLRTKGGKGRGGAIRIPEREVAEREARDRAVRRSDPEAVA